MVSYKLRNYVRLAIYFNLRLIENLFIKLLIKTASKSSRHFKDLSIQTVVVVLYYVMIIIYTY